MQKTPREKQKKVEWSSEEEEDEDDRAVGGESEVTEQTARIKPGSQRSGIPCLLSKYLTLVNEGLQSYF